MPETAKRGRPPKGDEAKRHSLAIRTTAETKALIVAAAAASGRSVAQEIEHRLERSLRDDAVLERLDRIEAFLCL